MRRSRDLTRQHHESQQQQPILPARVKPGAQTSLPAEIYAMINPHDMLGQACAAFAAAVDRTYNAQLHRLDAQRHQFFQVRLTNEQLLREARSTLGLFESAPHDTERTRVLGLGAMHASIAILHLCRAHLDLAAMCLSHGNVGLTAKLMWRFCDLALEHGAVNQATAAALGIDHPTIANLARRVGLTVFAAYVMQHGLAIYFTLRPVRG